jgi:hypothetical protein
MPPLLDAYWASGCPVCRGSWAASHEIDERLGYSETLQETIFLCRACGTYWQTTERAGPIPISAARAELALSGRPMVPDGGYPPPPETVVIEERQQLTERDGLLVQPSAFPWDPVASSDQLSQAQVLAAIADVLGLPLPHRMHHVVVRGNGLTERGYQLPAARDELDWEVVASRMLLTPDIGPDTSTGPVHAIGYNTPFLSMRGAHEILAVGAGATTK